MTPSDQLPVLLARTTRSPPGRLDACAVPTLIAAGGEKAAAALFASRHPLVDQEFHHGIAHRRAQLFGHLDHGLPGAVDIAMCRQMNRKAAAASPNLHRRREADQSLDWRRAGVVRRFFYQLSAKAERRTRQPLAAFGPDCPTGSDAEDIDLMI
jgi:hypothetical protein